MTITLILFFAVADNIMTYTVFLEIAPPDSPLSSLPSFDKDQVNILTLMYLKITDRLCRLYLLAAIFYTKQFFLRLGRDALFQILRSC